MRSIYEKTITSIFIVPTLEINREHLFNNNFINGFIADLEHEEYHEENVVFLLFKPKNLEKFKNFLEYEYSNNPLLIEDYDYDDYIVLIYKLKEKFKEDYTLIIKGKYSKVSKEFKNLFPKELINYLDKDLNKIPAIQHWIFNKDIKLINFWEKTLNDENSIIINNNLEVWPAFNPKTEVLDIEKIIKNEKNN